MKKTLLTIIIFFNFVSFCYGLPTDTHKLLNKYIAQSTLNDFSLNEYIQWPLGLNNGVNEVFNNKKVFELMGDGGAYEDKPPGTIPFLRSVNHFHNPLTKQGFNGLSWLLWGFFGVLDGQSSIQWSQNDIGDQSPGGPYSWHDVRNYFFNALTTTNDSDRQQYFADTFRGLGQLMHLVEDLSVPEHTRNAFHGISYGYEDWVIGKDGIIKLDQLSQYPPIYFDESSIGNAPDLANLGAVPITNLFDTNTYTGNNPDDTCDVSTMQDGTLISQIGLSEYTNANFISPSTAFTSGLLYPNWNSIVQSSFPSPTSRYLTKLGQGETAAGGKMGNGEHIDHFAVSRWGANLLPSSMSQDGVYLKMDSAVYAEYASHLIPRAIGYAAGLLKYFFRGQITSSGVVIANNWWNSTVPWDDIGIYFNKISNSTPGEIMGPGKLVVLYKYAPYYVTEHSGSCGEFIYSTSEIELNETIASGADLAGDYFFAFDNPISAWPNPHCVHVVNIVFRGKLGNEEDAVVPLFLIGEPQ